MLLARTRKLQFPRQNLSFSRGLQKSSGDTECEVLDEEVDLLDEEPMLNLPSAYFVNGHEFEGDIKVLDFNISFGEKQ